MCATGGRASLKCKRPGNKCGSRVFLTVLEFLAAFAAIWALYFTITEAPVAIKHDMTEAYAWGHEFQLGYNQHPPFWAWICGLWFSLFPRTRWAFALLSSLNAGIGLWGAWMAIGDFVEGRKRIAAWALLLLTPLYTFYAYRYNANTIFLSIWPWTLHYFMTSLQSRRIRDAVAFGVFVGLAMMSKYYALILVATCLLAALQHPSRWKYFAAAAPYVSAVVAALICAPHAWWLLTHQAPPLRYLANVSGQGWGLVLVHAGRTLVGRAGDESRRCRRRRAGGLDRSAQRDRGVGNAMHPAGHSAYWQRWLWRHSS